MLSNAFSAPIKAGCDFLGAQFYTKSVSNFQNETVSRPGLKVRSGLEVPLEDRFSIRVMPGYEMRTTAAQYALEDMVGLEDFISHSLTIDVAGQFMATDKIRMSAGAGYAMPLMTKAVHDWLHVLPKKENSVLISGGLAYQLYQNLSLELGYQYQLGSVRFQYVELKTQVFQFGIRYDVPLSAD
jgi:opacity protein-like surface antigen